MNRALWLFPVLLAAAGARAGVTVVQNVAPGATAWPGTPVLSTMSNPSSASVAQTFTTGVACTNLSQTFTITTTNYILQRIDLYAGGGSGTGSGTNLLLKLYDLGFQKAPEPSPYGGVVPNETLGGNMLGSGAGLLASYTPQPNGILQFDFDGTDQVLLRAGHMYVFELVSTVTSKALNWQCVTSGNPYSGGAAYTNKYWMNSGSSSCEFAMAVYCAVSESAPPAPSTLSATSTVTWSDLRQKIDGFGASSAWRSTWTTSQADLLFSTNTGAGLSLLRSRIAPGGTTVEIGIMQMAQARGARVWSTPWSPAAAFKDSGSVNGGNFYGGAATNQAYANQLAAYVLSMKNSYGVNIYALSVQNEPDVNTTGYESCVWTGQQIHDFVPYLSSALAANGSGATRILLPESQHWSSNPGLYTPALNDSAVAAQVSIIANHNYDGINSANTATSAPAAIANYGKPTWETEVSALQGSASSIYNGVYWASRIHAFLTVAGANAYHYWWLISGNSTANQGLFDSAGNPAKRLYALGQFSRFVRPDYFRLGVVTNSGTAYVSAFRDTNTSRFVIVAINPNPTNPVSQTIRLSGFTAKTVSPWVTSSSLSLSAQAPVTVTNGAFNYTLPAPGIVTFVGQYWTNTAPVLDPVADATLDATVAWSVTNTVTDPDVPPQNLTFTLLAGPAGAVLDPATGVFSWTPALDQAGSTNLVTVAVTDDGVPALGDTNSFYVVVNPLNSAPVLQPVADQMINPGFVLTLTNTATDAESPLQNLTFSLAAGPFNAVVDSDSGVFTWRPLVSQSSSSNRVAVVVTDDGAPPMSATNLFSIFVNPMVAPSFQSISAGPGGVLIGFDGLTGPDYTLLSSTDLVSWQVLFTTNPPAMPVILVDTNSSDAARFYSIQAGP